MDPLKVLWREYRDHTEFPREVAWDYVFQKIYIHAALQQQQAICDWLDEIFLDFDQNLFKFIKKSYLITF